MLRAERGGLAYRRRVAALEPDRDPEQAVVALVGCPSDGVLHSTSWRRDEAWGLVLTYVVLPDPRPDETPAVPLGVIEPARGDDALHPAPASITVDQVAAHAVRHLALLRRTDPVVAAALCRHAELDAAVVAAEPHPAGQLT